jgi:hypothetical protein
MLFMKKLKFILPILSLFILFGFSVPKMNKRSGECSGTLLQKNVTIDRNDDLFQRSWTYVSETSAVIYWQLDTISKSAPMCI